MQKNLSKAIEKIKLAKKKGAHIVCLPELFLPHYFCQEENHDNFAIAEKIPGKTTDTLCELAKKISVIIIVPLFEKKVSGLYHNSCVVIDEKGTIIITLIFFANSHNVSVVFPGIFSAITKLS